MMLVSVLLKNALGDFPTLNLTISAISWKEGISRWF